MELRHLRYFLAVAECGNVTQAALRLNISQPPLSRAIRELEAELGIDLFRRRKQRIALTSVGAMMVDEARIVVARADGLTRFARALSDGRGGRIRVGYVDGAMQGGALAAQLRNLRAACPNVVVDLVAASTETQLESISNGQVDIGIHYTPRRWPEETARWHLLSDPIMLAMPRDDVLVEKPDILPSDLEASPWVALPREGDPNWRERFLHECAAAGFRPDIRYEVAQLSGLLGIVDSGVGRAFAQASVSRAKASEIVLRSLPWWQHSVDYWLSWRRLYCAPAVVQFLEANNITYRQQG